MAQIREVEGFLTQAKKEYMSLCKRITKAEDKLEQLRLLRVENEALQNFLQEQINSLE